MDKVATKFPAVNDTAMAPFVIEFTMKTSIIEIEEQITEKTKPKIGLRRVDVKNSGTAMRTAYLIHGDTANVSPNRSINSQIVSEALSPMAIQGR